MKTVFKIEENKGLKSELRIHDANNSMLKILEFDFNNINNFYPLNSEYDLEYQFELDELRLVPVSNNEVTHVDYGIKTFRDTLRYDLTNGLDSIVIKQVQYDNLLVCSDARELGIPCWLDDFTYYEVQEGIKLINKTIDTMLNDIISNYYYDLSQDDKVTFMSKRVETKYALALANLSKAEENNFISCGKIYTMLSVMRKVSKLYA